MIDLAGTSEPNLGYPLVVYALSLKCAPEVKDQIIAQLWEHGTAGIVEQDLPEGRCGLRAFFRERFDTAEWSVHAARWEEVADHDWIAVAQAEWEVALVGDRFFLVPAWRDDVTPVGRVRLEMQPGLACGTGWGPATQLALEGMERRLVQGTTVLDIGTGSGILAVAAVRLGAGRVYACDIDSESVPVAAERFRNEGIEVGLFTGSARSVRDGSVNLVVANINAETLVELAPEILRVIRPEGAAILSGFPDRHLARVREAFGGRGEVLGKDEWRAVIWHP